MKPLCLAFMILLAYTASFGQAHRTHTDTQQAAIATAKATPSKGQHPKKAHKQALKQARKTARMERRLADPGLFAKIFLAKEMEAYAKTKAYEDSLATVAMAAANIPRMPALGYPSLCVGTKAQPQVQHSLLAADVYRSALPEKGYYFSVAQQWQYDSKLVAPTRSHFQPYAEFIRTRTYCNSPYTDPAARYQQLNTVVPGIAIYQRMVPTFQAGVSYWIH